MGNSDVDLKANRDYNIITESEIDKEIEKLFELYHPVAFCEFD